MNKLFIDNVLDLENVVITEDTILIEKLNDVSKDVHIYIDKNVCLYEIAIIKNSKNKIIYHLSQGSNVIINKIAIDNSDTVYIYLDGENASVKINNGLINYYNNTYTLKIYHNEEKTTSNIVNHTINVKDNDFTFDIDVIIPKDKENINSNQDNRIINMGSGKNIIKPNLIVDNHNITANHSAYIGQFDKNSVFYLMTRGLSYETIKDMLAVAFLLNDMDLQNLKDEVTAFVKNNI